MSKILVVDDSSLIRQCVAKLLEQSGHTATTAANGKEAWAMLYAGVPDLIVLDLMMPQMDGLTFLRLLRHNHFWNETPVIVSAPRLKVRMRSPMSVVARPLGRLSMTC